jgi:hypothetical protein
VSIGRANADILSAWQSGRRVLAQILRRGSCVSTNISGDWFCWWSMRKLSEQPAPSTATQAFTALSEADKRVLHSWISAARAAGIDDVRDLAGRRWPVAITGALIGMFTRGDDHAAWLMIEHNGRWVVACCIDGSVSPPLDSLEDALAIVHHACEASEWA